MTTDQRSGGERAYCDNESAAIAAARRHSEMFVQTIFASLSIGFAILALIAHHRPTWLALDGLDSGTIATALLFMACGYALMMVVWNHLWHAGRGTTPGYH